MIKFLSKNLWWMLGLFLILVMFYSAPANFYRSKDSAGAMSESYVENSNNLLINGAFNTNGVSSYSPWYNSNSNASVVVTDSGAVINYIGSGGQGYFIQDLNTSLYRGKTLTFSAMINNTLYSTTWQVPTNGTGGSNGINTINRYFRMRFYVYSDSRLGITFDIISGLTETVTIRYAKVEIGSEATPFYVLQKSSNVNFYSANNKDIIYSVDIPFGYSLQDLENNTINSNSSFLDGSNGYRFWGSPVITYNNPGLTLQATSSTANIEFDLKNFIDFSKPSFYLISDVSNISNILQFYCYYRFNNQSIYLNKQIVSFNNYSVIFFDLNSVPSDISYFNIGIQFKNTISFTFFNVCYENLPYFNQDYVNQLYKNSGGILKPNGVWSMSPTAYIKYNNLDSNLYYIVNFQKFTLIGQLENFFKPFVSVSLTKAMFDDIPIQWDSLKNSFNYRAVDYFDSTNSIEIVNILKKVLNAIITFVNVIGIILFVFVNFVKLFILICGLIIAPFIDLSLVLIRIFTGTLVSWSYIV